MTIIPGDAYRIDVVGADEQVIVDSWTSQVKGNVVTRDGVLQVDTTNGKIYGPLVGDIEDISGNTIFNNDLRLFTTDIKGDVRNTNGNIVLNSEQALLVGNMQGNMYDSEGVVMINHTTKSIDATTIVADSITGTFYGTLNTTGTIRGNLIGNVVGDVTGEVTGNTTGHHFGNVDGNVTGDVTGNVTGDLYGQIMAVQRDETDPTVLIAYNEHASHRQWEMRGGISHIDNAGKGPILGIGATRTDAYLKADIVAYDGTPQLTLTPTEDYGPEADIVKSNYFGAVKGRLMDGTTDIMTWVGSTTSIYANNGVLQLGMDYTSDIEFNAESIVKNFNISDGDATELVNAFRGTPEAKTALQTSDPMLMVAALGYNGAGFVDAGHFGFFVDRNTAPTSTDSSVKTGFSVALGTGSATPIANQSMNLEFNSAGVLEVPVFKARGTNFAARDSMTAEAGMIIFNTSNNKFQGYTGSAWVDLH